MGIFFLEPQTHANQSLVLLIFFVLLLANLLFLAHWVLVFTQVLYKKGKNIIVKIKKQSGDLVQGLDTKPDVKGEEEEKLGDELEAVEINEKEEEGFSMRRLVKSKTFNNSNQGNKNSLMPVEHVFDSMGSLHKMQQVKKRQESNFFEENDYRKEGMPVMTIRVKKALPPQTGQYGQKAKKSIY